MAQVTLTIGDRTYVVACADGGESRLAELGAMLDERWAGAARATGNAGSERTMLLVALMLADDLDEAAASPSSGAPLDGSALAALANRLERLAETLEQEAQSA